MKRLAKGMQVGSVAANSNEPTELFVITSEPWVNNNNDIVMAGIRVEELQGVNGYVDYVHTWIPRKDLDWVAKVAKKAIEFIEESGGIKDVMDSFYAYEYPNLYINKTKTQVVDEWLSGLPLAMENQTIYEVAEFMRTNGYKGDDSVEHYNTVFAIVVSEAIFSEANVEYEFSWYEATR